MQQLLFIIGLLLIGLAGFSQQTYHTLHTDGFSSHEYFALLNEYEDSVLLYATESYRKVRFDTDYNTFYLLKRKKNLYLLDSNMSDTLASLIKRKHFVNHKTNNKYRVISTTKGFMFFDEKTNDKVFESKLEYAFRGYKISVVTNFDQFEPVPIIFAWYKAITTLPAHKPVMYEPKRTTDPMKR